MNNLQIKQLFGIFISCITLYILLDFARPISNNRRVRFEKHPSQDLSQDQKLFILETGKVAQMCASHLCSVESAAKAYPTRKIG